MLRLIERLATALPAPLHRAGLRLAYRARKWIYRTMRFRTAGVGVILTDGAGRVLLVRHGYGSRRWAIPGGGMGRGEEPFACARREIAEELACSVAELRMVRILHERLYGTHHTAHLLAGRVVGTPRPDDREILECSFFAIDDLPHEPDLMPVSRRRLRYWLENLEQR